MRNIHHHHHHLHSNLEQTSMVHLRACLAFTLNACWDERPWRRLTEALHPEEQKHTSLLSVPHAAGSSEPCIKERLKHSQMRVVEFQVKRHGYSGSAPRFTDELHPSLADLLQATCVCHSCPSGGEHLQKVISSVQENTSSSSSPSLCRRRLPASRMRISALLQPKARLLDMLNPGCQATPSLLNLQMGHPDTDSCWLAGVVREAGPPESPVQWCHWSRKKRCWLY